jgi:hypothetical protein
MKFLIINVLTPEALCGGMGLFLGQPPCRWCGCGIFGDSAKVLN